MDETKFKEQLMKLYGNNPEHRKKLEWHCFSKKGFMEIAKFLNESERIEALAPIADNPQGWGRTKTSFMQNWYIILTNSRMIFASPTLILKEITAASYSYKILTSVQAGKWNSIKITAQGYVGFLSITGSYFYYEQRDELIRIIERHMNGNLICQPQNSEDTNEVSESNNSSNIKTATNNKQYSQKTLNRKAREEIKAEKEFEMKIEKKQYAEEKKGKGFYLSGLIRKGGIYQTENSEIVIEYVNGSKSSHRVISVSSKQQHKQYNYAKKGQYVHLFIEAEESLNLDTAVRVCEFNIIENVDNETKCEENNILIDKFIIQSDISMELADVIQGKNYAESERYVIWYNEKTIVFQGNSVERGLCVWDKWLNIYYSTELNIIDNKYHIEIINNKFLISYKNLTSCVLEIYEKTSETIESIYKTKCTEIFFSTYVDKVAYIPCNNCESQNNITIIDVNCMEEKDTGLQYSSVDDWELGKNKLIIRKGEKIYKYDWEDKTELILFQGMGDSLRAYAYFNEELFISHIGYSGPAIIGINEYGKAEKYDVDDKWYGDVKKIGTRGIFVSERKKGITIFDMNSKKCYSFCPEKLQCEVIGIVGHYLYYSMNTDKTLRYRLDLHDLVDEELINI